MENTININQKPGTVKAIQILMITKVFLALTFYIVLTILDKKIGDAGPVIALYTAIGYAVTAFLTVLSINKRKVWALRGVLLVDVLVSLPAKGIIGFVFVAISLVLSAVKKSNEYFNNK